jgi:hypothetical protein
MGAEGGDGGAISSFALGGCCDQIRFATVKGVGLDVLWVRGLAVRWSGRVLYGGVVVILTSTFYLARSYLSAVWPIRDLDDEGSYSLDKGSCRASMFGMSL